MHSKLKKSAIILIALIIVIFFVIFYIMSTNNRIKNSDELIDIKINVNEENVSITDKFPMNDDLGKSIKYDFDNKEVQGYVEIEVTNDSASDTNFELFSIENEYENNIHPNYIKMYLTDESNNPLDGYNNLSVPTYYNLRVSSLNPSGKRLYYGHLKAFEIKKFILRFWVGDAYSIHDSLNEFGIKLYAKYSE